MADGGYPNKIKRPCLEDVTLSMGQGTQASTPCAELQVASLAMTPSPAAMGVAGHPLLMDNNPMNGSVMGSPFSGAPPAEMGLKAPPIPYYDKSAASSSLPAVDQELQELLEELTKIQEPSPSDLDLEKILGTKPEEPLVLDHPQATLGATPKPSVQMPHLESLSSGKEFTSSCSQAAGVSLPVPPSSAGLNYTISAAGKQMVSPSNAGAQAKNPAPATLPVALPPLPVPQWHHAHQLKVLAASKQGSATKPPGPTPGWSGLPPPGLSPPYRPVPSPHPPPPPFSPQNLMVSCLSSSNLPGSAVQGSPNALLSSMAPGGNAALGPALPYAPEKLPSPALQPPPPFSSQNSILANLVSSTVKSPPGHLLSTLPSSTPGPSPPYRPEKLSSPSLPQQSFTPQCPLIRSLTPTGNQLGPQPPPPPPSANAIFKPMSASSSKTLSMIMQQGLASPGAPEPFSFSNTKPLSHFVAEPGPQKMPSLPTTSRQQSLLHYLQQPAPASASVPSASSPATATLKLQPQPDHAPYLLQQMMQPPPRCQRSLASEPMPSLSRQQEKQRSGLMAMTPEQRSAYIAQQMSQFQAVQEQVTSKCSRTKASPPSSQHKMPPRPGLLHNPSPGIIPPTRHQSQAGMGTTSAAPGTLHSGLHVSIPLCSGPNPAGRLSSVCQRTQIPKAASLGVPLLGFCPSPLGSKPSSPHQLRQPCVPRMPIVFNNATWGASVAAGATVVSREAPPSRIDSSMQQCLNSNSSFTKVPRRVPLVAPCVFPSQQAAVSPNQVAPGGRSGQKVGAALANPNFSLLGSQNLRQSPVQGPVPVLSATTSLQQGVACLRPLSPIQGIEPPSYVAAAATAASAIAASPSPGPLKRLGTPSELPPYDFLTQPPLGDVFPPPDCREEGVIEALLKGPSTSPDEAWVCDLRLIDDILGQQAAVQKAAAQGAGPAPQSAGELPTPTRIEPPLGHHRGAWPEPVAGSQLPPPATRLLPHCSVSGFSPGSSLSPAVTTWKAGDFQATCTYLKIL